MFVKFNCMFSMLIANPTSAIHLKKKKKKNTCALSFAYFFVITRCDHVNQPWS